MTHKFNVSEARKYSVIYQLFNLILLGFFGLAILLSTFRFETFRGTQESGFALGLALDKWQVASLFFIMIVPLLIAYVSAPWLLNRINLNNRYSAGIIFTFVCWFLPLIFAQSMDEMNSFPEIWRSLMPAAIAAIMFGPLLGRKIWQIKEKTAG